jgi:hypothetical protein
MKAMWMMSVMACMSMPAFAMDLLDDGQLAESTGQDGISITIQPKSAGQAGLIGFSDVALIDRDGFTGLSDTTINGVAYTNAGSSVLNMRAGSGIQLLTSTGTFSTGAITIDTDIDGSAGQGSKPMLYTTINLPADVARIKADIQDLSIRADTLSGSTVIAGTVEKPIVQFSQGITFNLASQLRLALVLGAEGTAANANHFMTLVSANFSSIDFGTISLPSIGGAVGESSLSATVSINNLDLSGAYLDIVGTGLTFGKASIGPFNASINNITLGSTAATPSATIFNGTNVGALGSLGANGITVTNMKLTVSGM